MTDKEYRARMAHIRSENSTLLKMQKLENEKNKYKKKKRLPSTSKLMAIYLFALLNVVIVYSLITMYQFHDLSYLGVLITDIAAQILVYFIYSVKSAKENCKSGIVYETAMAQINTTVNEEIQTVDTETSTPDTDVAG